MRVSVRQARYVMRRLREGLRTNFSPLKGAKEPQDKKQLLHRIIFMGHPIRVELYELLPKQQYAIVVVLHTKKGEGEEKWKPTKLWLMGAPRKAKGFCPARSEILADPTHMCGQCRDVERVTEEPQEGEDFVQRMVNSILPVVESALRSH